MSIRRGGQPVYRSFAASDFSLFPSSFIRRLHSSRAAVNPAAVGLPFAK